MNLEGIQTIRIMQTVFGLIEFQTEKRLNWYWLQFFQRTNHNILAKILADLCGCGQHWQTVPVRSCLSYQDSQVCFNISPVMTSIPVFPGITFLFWDDYAEPWRSENLMHWARRCQVTKGKYGEVVEFDIFSLEIKLKNLFHGSLVIIYLIFT